MKRLAIDLNDVYRDFSGKFTEIYTRNIDDTFELGEEGVFSNRFDEVFPFESRDEYVDFRYNDFAYESYGRADVVGRNVPSVINNWINKDLDNLDCEEAPEVSIISPFEYRQTIQATMSFLSLNPLQVREFYFPKNIDGIWDRYDIIITADPEIIESCPEGKHVFKIETDYNKNVECENTYATLIDVIEDTDEKLINILNGR